MEEKERYELFGEHCIKDNNPDARPQLFDACAACVILNEQYKHIKDLEDKLADSEKQIKDAREAGNMAVDSWCKNRRKYEAQIAEMQNKSFILYSMLYETLEKQGCDNVASQIDQMTGWTYDKEADWLKGNRNYDQLKQQLAEKDKEIKQLKQSQKQLAIEKLTMFEAMLSRAVQWDNDSKCWTISEEVFGNFIVQIDEKIEELKGEETI